MNMPAPKVFSRLPDASNLRTGGTVEPAQLSYRNGDAPGGMSGFAPHRFTTHTDSPSLSMATPFSAPHVLPAGRFPHGAMVWYGLGRSFVGSTSPCAFALAPHSVMKATVTSVGNLSRFACGIRSLSGFRRPAGVAFGALPVPSGVVRVFRVAAHRARGGHGERRRRLLCHLHQFPGRLGALHPVDEHLEHV